MLELRNGNAFLVRTAHGGQLAPKLPPEDQGIFATYAPFFGLIISDVLDENEESSFGPLIYGDEPILKGVVNR